MRKSESLFRTTSGYSVTPAEDGVEEPTGEADDGRSGKDGAPIPVAQMQDEAGQIDADEARDRPRRVHQTKQRARVLGDQILGGWGAGGGSSNRGNLDRTHSPRYLLTRPPTHSPTHSPTHPLTAFPSEEISKPESLLPMSCVF